MARDLGPPLVHLERLEEVDDAPVARLQLDVRLVGDRQHLVGGGEPLGEPVRPPQRHVARVERGRDGAPVAGAARHRDRL